MKFIILDRDGVINYDSDNYIKSPEEWLPIPGSLEAIARLNLAGYRVVIATNQSGVGRGLFDLNTLTKIHYKMEKCLDAYQACVDGVYFCPHVPEDNCMCRKPKPGMFNNIANDFKLDLTKAIFVGDALTDMQVANNVGCRFILVLTGKGKQFLSNNVDIARNLETYCDLAAVVDSLIKTKYAG